ncbi:LOW QUALITY PROTEIN: hypothetical protein Cgig2_008315 [Carnegiea gigantea]|uniref:Uncharacterized protein n=1 Tax=Carnegiea gigantea TaxID=171969 RepID=A0A9Q1GPJ0_9CARY|nr:LOW QUALITY PROTEIN: hypothetical protein Cgig2_008315 [Carnegiea gigantea]
MRKALLGPLGRLSCKERNKFLMPSKGAVLRSLQWYSTGARARTLPRHTMTYLWLSDMWPVPLSDKSRLTLGASYLKQTIANCKETNVLPKNATLSASDHLWRVQSSADLQGVPFRIRSSGPCFPLLLKPYTNTNIDQQAKREKKRNKQRPFYIKWRGPHHHWPHAQRPHHYHHHVLQPHHRKARYPPYRPNRLYPPYEVNHIRVLALVTSLATVFDVPNMRLELAFLFKFIREFLKEFRTVLMATMPPKPPSLSLPSPSSACTWPLTLLTFGASSGGRRSTLTKGHWTSRGRKFASPGRRWTVLTSRPLVPRRRPGKQYNIISQGKKK